MKTLAEWTKKPTSQVIGMYFTEAWYFEKAYEKLILVGLCILGMWKIYGWFF